MINKKENDFNSFVMYHDFYDVIEDMELEEKGLLLDAIFKYQLGLEYQTGNRIVDISLKQLIKTFERDKNKWLEIKEKRRNAVNKRWDNERNKEPKQNLNKPSDNLDKPIVKKNNNNILVNDFFEELKEILSKNYSGTISTKLPTKKSKDKLSLLLNKKEIIIIGYTNYIKMCKNENRELKYIKSLDVFLNQETYLDYQELNIKKENNVNVLTAEESWD